MQIEDGGIGATLSATTTNFSFASRNYPFQSWSARFPHGGQTAASFGDITSNLFWSQNVGPVHVLVLNSYVPYAPGSPQYAFASADLQSVNRTATPWLIVMHHTPVYHSYHIHFKDSECFRNAYEPLYLQFSVDFVVVGHVHAMERTRPIYNYVKNQCGPGAPRCCSLSVAPPRAAPAPPRARAVMRSPGKTEEEQVGARRTAAFSLHQSRLRSALWSRRRSDDRQLTPRRVYLLPRLLLRCCPVSVYMLLGEDGGNVEGPYRQFIDDIDPAHGVPWCLSTAGSAAGLGARSVNKYFNKSSSSYNPNKWGPGYQRRVNPSSCVGYTFQPTYSVGGQPGLLQDPQGSGNFFCQSSQPLWSAFRDPRRATGAGGGVFHARAVFCLNCHGERMALLFARRMLRFNSAV